MARTWKPRRIQDNAMACAETGLAASVMKGLGANNGHLAFSALPAVEAGHAVVKGRELERTCQET